MPPSSSSSLPISPIDLRLNQDVLSLILDHVFHIHEPQTPQSTLVSTDPRAVHLLLVSKAFSKLVLPRLWNTIVLRSSEDWTLLFERGLGELAGRSNKPRRRLVKRVLVDLAVHAPMFGMEEIKDDTARLQPPLTFNSLPAVTHVVLLSPKDTSEEDKQIARDSKVTRLLVSFRQFVNEEDGVDVDEFAEAEYWYEFMANVEDESREDREKFFRSLGGGTKPFTVEGELGDARFSRIVFDRTQWENELQEKRLSLLEVFQTLGVTLRLVPGRRADWREKRGHPFDEEPQRQSRGYHSLDEDLLLALKILLKHTDELPRLFLAEFPSSWPKKIADWIKEEEVKLDKDAKEINWVSEDGSLLPLLAQSTSLTSELSSLAKGVSQMFNQDGA